jgi:hypothetical protein
VPSNDVFAFECFFCCFLSIVLLICPCFMQLSKLYRNWCHPMMSLHLNASFVVFSVLFCLFVHVSCSCPNFAQFLGPISLFRCPSTQPQTLTQTCTQHLSCLPSFSKIEAFILQHKLIKILTKSIPYHLMFFLQAFQSD